MDAGSQVGLLPARPHHVESRIVHEERRPGVARRDGRTEVADQRRPVGGEERVDEDGFVFRSSYRDS